MKKLIAMTLILCMVMALFAGCVAFPVRPNRPVGTKPVESLPAETDPADTNPGGGDEGQKDETEPQVKPSGEVTVEEAVIYEGNDVKITVKGLDEGWSGPELKVLLENNTDKNIALSMERFVINGITIEGYGYVEAAAGKKANDTISIYGTDLEAAGIDTLATIVAMNAHIVDTDSYNSLFQVPFSVTTSAGADYVQEINDSGDVVFEDSGVTVISQVFTGDDYIKSVRLLVKNETGKDIIVKADNVSANGFTIYSWMYDTVYADTVCFCELEMYTSDLEENGIEQVEDVCFTLEVIDPENYDTITESDEIQVFVEQ